MLFLKNGWESWKGKREWVIRDNLGRFLKGNLHISINHKKAISEARKGWKYSDITKNKISNKLRGMPFTSKRKKNISLATKKASYKWAKTCRHGITPLYKCEECNRESKRNAGRKYDDKNRR